MITIEDFAVCTFFLLFVVVVVVVFGMHLLFVFCCCCCFLACANYAHFLFLAIYTFFIFLYYINFFYNSERVFGIQTTLLKCGQMFSSLRVCTKLR